MPDMPLKITGIDLGDLSKPATKLIQTVGKFIGVVYEPQHIRQRAKAEADAARILAVAQVDTDRILAEGRLELQEDLQQKALRASERISNRELRRQANIEAVVCRALHQLPDSVGKEAVEEDWIAEFFNVCQDVSNGKMQTIWARLLAGEVTEPGTYSRRTLYFVRLLSPFDAAIFQNICNYIWHTSELHSIHFHTDRTAKLLTQKGLSFEAFLHMGSLGLISTNPNVNWDVESGEKGRISYFGKQYQLINTSGQRRGLATYVLTDTAKELAPLCDSAPDEEYRLAVIEAWTKLGVKVEAQS